MFFNKLISHFVFCFLLCTLHVYPQIQANSEPEKSDNSNAVQICNYIQSKIEQVSESRNELLESKIETLNLNIFGCYAKLDGLNAELNSKLELLFFLLLNKQN